MLYHLADVNVWLATLVPDHPHHRAAARWWREVVEPTEERVAFCRITQLGVLRLLTNPRVMGPQSQTIEQAWALYRWLLVVPLIEFAREPPETEARLGEYCGLGGSSRKFWTDGYLAAFARAGGAQLVTFDRGFRRYPELNLTLLDT